MTLQLSLRAVSLESRHGHEMTRLLERHGMQPIAAPSLREVPLTDQAEAFAFGAALVAGECDVLVLLTGVGARALLAALRTRWSDAVLMPALGRLQLVCRGPKPVAVLKELGLRPSVVAPEPNTWRELVQAMSGLTLAGKRVWVQEYGKPNDALVASLVQLGAEVRSAAVYAWQLPEDLGPLRAAVEALCTGGADAILFTSARQLDHLWQVADAMGRREALVSALVSRVLVASIGPVTSEALRNHGMSADLEPQHPKMGHLVKALATDGVRLLERKRAAR
jgi:uroporphyrinogen-III synthase